MLNNAPVQLGIKIISAIYDKTPVDDLKNLCDNIRGKDQNVVIVFGTSADDKASLVCAASKNAVEKGIDCGIIIREASSVVGGKGGGRKDMAQAGGKDITKLNDAIAKAVTVIKDMIK